MPERRWIPRFWRNWVTYQREMDELAKRIKAKSDPLAIAAVDLSRAVGISPNEALTLIIRAVEFIEKRSGERDA